MAVKAQLVRRVNGQLMGAKTIEVKASHVS